MPDRKLKREEQQGERAAKTCASCGRTMAWRKSWAKTWEEVKFCSEGCRKRRVSAVDERLEQVILQLVHERGTGKTICPSEAARAVAASEVREIWEPLMEPARAAARRLAAQGRIAIMQGGHEVDASTAKGPIRLRLR